MSLEDGILPAFNTPQYLAAGKSANQSVSSGGDVTWDITESDGITITSSTLFNLKAGRVYELTAYIRANTSGQFRWVDAANATFGSIPFSYSETGTPTQIVCKNIFAPLVDTDVKVRKTNLGSASVTTDSAIVIRSID